MKRTQRHAKHYRFVQVTSFALVSVLFVCALIAQTPMPQAFAVTSAQKQAEADAAKQRLDELQTELNQVSVDYENAVAVHADALQRMTDAKNREEAAQKRIAELQVQLSDLAAKTYRNGPNSYLDVLFGAQSFADFVSAWEMVDRMSVHHADLVAESKVVRAEAEAARIEYTEQEKVAGEKKDEIGALKTQKETTAANLQAEISSLQAQAADLLAQEELAAEAAQRRIAEDARSGGGSSYVDPAIVGRISLVHPCPNGTFTSGFGPRWGTYHLGTDFGAPTGSAILAAASGTVTFAGVGPTQGNYVTINHGNGVVTTYMHASAIYVSPGQSVFAGQTIAAVGSTGDSTGPHLHFQLNIDGRAVDPMAFL